MEKISTELVFILDKSGSMSGLEDDTIGGFNAMLEKQRASEGPCRVTTVLFSDVYELLHDRIDLCAVKPITPEEYQVGGSTALLDAVGRSIHKLKSVRRSEGEDDRADRVLFVIITDGYENSSREYSYKQIRREIEDRREKNGWEFIFLGANIDAVGTASDLGISSKRAANYVSDASGTRLSYRTMSKAIRTFRERGIVEEESLDEIRADAAARGGRK